MAVQHEVLDHLAVAGKVEAAAVLGVRLVDTSRDDQLHLQEARYQQRQRVVRTATRKCSIAAWTRWFAVQNSEGPIEGPGLVRRELQRASDRALEAEPIAA